MNSDVFQLITTVIALVFGWLFKVIWDTIKEVKDDMKDLSEIVHTDFARKDDFKESIADIKQQMAENRKDFKEDVAEVKKMLGRIFDKLEAR